VTKRAILYARVSTDEQAAKGYSLPTQLEACQAEAARRNLSVSPKLTFTDDYSGATLDRPGLAQLRAAAKPGDSIIVYDPDRLSRDDVDFLVICREFDRVGAQLVFVNGGTVPDSAEGDIIRYLMGWKGKRERAQIIERSLRGRRAKAASGKWVGTGHAPYGYRRVGERQNCHLEIDEAEAAIIREIFGRFINGEAILTIAASLAAAGVLPPNRSRVGVRWYRTSLKRILQNKIYLGVLEQYGQTTRDMQLAIVHLGTWEAAQARLANNRREFSPGQPRDYLLTSFIECSCGGSMYGCHVKPTKRMPRHYMYYVCSRRNHRESTCREKNLPMAKVDAIAWKWILDILCNDERREKGLREFAARRASEAEPLKTEAESVDELAAKAERKVNRLAAALADEDDAIKAAAFNQQMTTAAQELARLRERQAHLAGLIEQHEISQGKIDEIRSVTAAIRRRLPGDPSNIQKRDLFDVLDVRIKQRRDEAGRRWLDLSCGIPDWDFTVENHFSATRSG
jgi:site-specific DNA recombinase